MQPPREPPPRQIPIDRRPLTQPSRVPSLKAFRRRPSTPVDRPRRAAIRNPAQLRKYLVRRVMGSSAPKAGFPRHRDHGLISPVVGLTGGRGNDANSIVARAARIEDAPNKKRSTDDGDSIRGRSAA